MSQISDVQSNNCYSEMLTIAFKTQSFEKIDSVIKAEKLRLHRTLKSNIDMQVKRTRAEESSPKNTTLYFSLLLETKGSHETLATKLVRGISYSAYDSSVEPANIVDDEESE